MSTYEFWGTQFSLRPIFIHTQSRLGSGILTVGSWGVGGAPGFFKNYFIYLFAASGLSCPLLQCVGFSLVVACGFSLSSCGMWAPEWVGSVVVAFGLSSCDTWA